MFRYFLCAFNSFTMCLMLYSFLLLAAEIFELARQHKYVLAKYDFMVAEQGGKQIQDGNPANVVGLRKSVKRQKADRPPGTIPPAAASMAAQEGGASLAEPVAGPEGLGADQRPSPSSCALNPTSAPNPTSALVPPRRAMVGTPLEGPSELCKKWKVPLGNISVMDSEEAKRTAEGLLKKWEGFQERKASLREFRE